MAILNLPLPQETSTEAAATPPTIDECRLALQRYPEDQAARTLIQAHVPHVIAKMDLWLLDTYEAALADIPAARANLPEAYRVHEILESLASNRGLKLTPEAQARRRYQAQVMDILAPPPPLEPPTEALARNHAAAQGLEANAKAAQEAAEAEARAAALGAREENTSKDQDPPTRPSPTLKPR